MTTKSRDGGKEEQDKQQHIIFGIDPGSADGQCAMMFYHGGPTPHTMYISPLSDRVPKRWMELVSINKFKGVFCVIERQWARPKTDIKAVTKLIEIYGITQGWAEMADIPILLIPPNVWKRYFNISTKRDSVERFIEIFKESRVVTNLDREIRLVKDHNLAEAALIGHYGYLNRPDIQDRK